MMLRTTFVGALAIVALAACGDDTGGAGGSGSAGGDGGAGPTTGSGNTTSGNTSSSGDGGSGAGTGEGGSGAGTGDGGGGGGAGTPYDCASYCADVMEACDAELAQYPNAESCEVACAAFAEGEFQDAGNTLGCRAYHAQAALDAPAVHCAHAGPLGTGACATAAESPCQAFCQIAEEICPGSYASVGACEKVCSGYDAGEFNAGPTPPSDDTLACRAYHLTVAGSDLDNGTDDLHCPHIVGDSPTCPAPQ